MILAIECTHSIICPLNVHIEQLDPFNVYIQWLSTFNTTYILIQVCIKVAENKKKQQINRINIKWTGSHISHHNY